MKSWYLANSTLLVTCATEARRVVADNSLERPLWLAASASASLLPTLILFSEPSRSRGGSRMAPV